MSSSFVEPNFLLLYPQSVNDYRSVVNATGTTAVFERALIVDGEAGPFQLYSMDLTTNHCTVTGSNLRPFLTAPSSLVSATRPDWAWLTTGSTSLGPVAFTWTDSSNVMWLGLVGAQGGTPTLVKGSYGSGTKGLEYPTWSPSAGTLVAASFDPKRYATTPCSVSLTAAGEVITPALAGPSMWAGMPSINQSAPSQLAFAGQPSQSGGKYDQDTNYIWTMDMFEGPGSVKPLEHGCPTSSYDPAFQGRAPWWSPDGKWVVFESTGPLPRDCTQYSCTKSAPKRLPSR